MKDCLMAVVYIMRPEKKQLVFEISFSAATRRIESLSSDM